MNGPSLLKSGEWPFKPSIEILKKIRLAGPACDHNEGLQQASNFYKHFDGKLTLIGQTSSFQGLLSKKG